MSDRVLVLLAALVFSVVVAFVWARFYAKDIPPRLTFAQDFWAALVVTSMLLTALGAIVFVAVRFVRICWGSPP